MSSDTVERLREWIKPHAKEKWQFSHYPEELNPCLLAEAADEIDRLAQALRDAKAEEREACAKVADKVYDTNKRLLGNDIGLSIQASIAELIAETIRNREQE